MEADFKATILNVEDHDAVRYSRSRILRKAGFEVLEASTGQEALEITKSRRPDLAILDVHLPDMKGLEVCRLLKADPETASVLVLHISATAVALEDRVKGLEWGADNYLVEPLEEQVLIASVKALLRIRKIERELEASEERFRLASEAVQATIYDLDLKSGVVNRTRGLQKLLGFLPEEAEPVMEWWESRIHPEDRDRTRERYLAAFAEGPGFNLEYRIRHQNGRYIWISDSGLIVRDAEGRARRLVGSTIDITDRKQVEEGRKELLEREKAAGAEAQRANRMKDEFLATLSHELRTPLQSILGWLWVARTGGPAIQEAVETAERNARLLSQLIDDLLDVSRIISGKLKLDLQAVDLRTTIAAALDVVRPAAEARKIAIQLSLDHEVSMVSGDANRLQQVVWNLLSNAVKFTPEGGTVEVRLERSESHAKIKVRDTGKGITADFLPYIFDRFRQADSSTSRNFAGLGLGLAIVRHLVELHGGTVQAESEGEGKGATFTVTLLLPAVRVPGDYLQRSPRPVEVAPSEKIGVLKGLRVLVVEDDPDARGWLRVSLSREGAQVTASESAAQALEALRRSWPDVLVSDIGMPGEDGYSFIRKVRAMGESGVRLAAVAVTAYAREEDRVRALSTGYHAYLAKPVESRELISTVATLAGRSTAD
jgi:PAS domain S-box-containing protein